MISARRFSLPQADLPADTNIRPHYPINNGFWTVHPEASDKENSFCRYTLSFELESDATFDIHVSADNRFELRCDGDYIGMGPDRSDIDRWSFHSYTVALEKGAHAFVADVHFLAEGYPYAQCAIEPAFVLYSDNAPVEISTGVADWQAQKLVGVTCKPAYLRTFTVVGPGYEIDASAFFNPAPAVDAKVLRKAGRNFGGGNVHPGWKLYPSRLPEQIHEPTTCGRVRVVDQFGVDDPIPAENGDDHPEWQSFVAGETAVTIPPETQLTVLWDLDDYYTAYPELTTDGGAGASISMEWAESCYEHLLSDTDHKVNHIKGNRDEVTGKYFRGLGDVFNPDGMERTFRSFWWRAGRYIRMRIQTAGQPLTLKTIVLIETRLPLENESTFASSDPEFAPIIDVSVRGIQMCAHETYMDCPYYEQMMYVGDTRIQALTAFIMSAEDRLNQRALELFDWSRKENGFVLERHPSRPKQLSTTFSMIWILMLRDYTYWRNDPEFMKQRLKGMRCLLEEFKAIRRDDGLLPALPGWSFMDWVGDMSFVNNPGPDASVSGVVTMLFLNTLNAAAEIEDVYGESHLAAYNRAWAQQIAASAKAMFWNDARGLFDDYPDKNDFSEHTQCLALLSNHFPELEQRCFESLITTEGLTPTTVYFSYYLLETFAKFGRGDLILKKLDFWKNMVKQGFKTPVETPEPSRSDCHAWGSHPLFHMHASLAGIRPASPGFKTLSITPLPGTLTEIESTLPHPDGKISLRMTKAANEWAVRITLPEGVSGSLYWLKKDYAIQGDLELVLPVQTVS